MEGWEKYPAGELKASDSQLYDRVLQVVRHAYTHVLKRQPASGTFVDDWYGEFNVSFRPEDAHPVAYINVVSGAHGAPERSHDMSIAAARKTVQIGQSHKPLEGTAEHDKTLVDLNTWVRQQSATIRERRAREAERKRRREEERRVREADPAWQERQRKEAEQRQAAEEAERVVGEERRQESERQEQERQAELQQRSEVKWRSKARRLLAKMAADGWTPEAAAAAPSALGSGIGSEVAAADGVVDNPAASPLDACASTTTSDQAVTDGQGEQQQQQVHEGLSPSAEQYFACQACHKRLRFCSHDHCMMLLEDSCDSECDECEVHPEVDDDRYVVAADEWVMCPGQDCEEAFCRDHEAEGLECCANCDDEEPACAGCSGLSFCEECGEGYCHNCISNGYCCECWVYEQDMVCEDTEDDAGDGCEHDGSDYEDPC